MDYVFHKEQRAIIVPGDPAFNTRVPSARAFEYKGRQLWAVPFNTREAQMLRAEGYPVPSPIGTYYNWPREMTSVPQPFHNQVETASFLTLHHRAYCLNEIGTGKTMSALWAADWLMREGLVRKVLIATPLSTMERVWADAVFTHLGHRACAVLHGTAAKRKRLFANNAFDFYVINHDGLDIIADLTHKTIRPKPIQAPDGSWIEQPGQRILVDAKLMRDDIDLVIVDEIGVFRNRSTGRWKILNKMVKPNMWGWGLTGTPIPNAPSDAYAQIKLLTPRQVPDFFTEFRQMTMQQLTEYIWVPRKEGPEVVYKAMQPAIRFTRDECFDLPPCTYTTLQAPLTTEQQRHYKEIANDLYTEVQGGKITAINEGVKISKLLQAACGVVYDTDGIAREIGAKPRIDLVKEIIDAAGHKVIIFVPFTAPLLMLQRELEKDYSVAVVHGGISKSKRDTIFAEFQNFKNPRVLLADAGCMSHGLTLTEANVIVWYAPEASNDIYEQANGRITRPGQENKQYIIHIAATETERRMYNRLKERGRIQGLLLEMVTQGVSL